MPRASAGHRDEDGKAVSLTFRGEGERFGENTRPALFTGNVDDELGDCQSIILVRFLKELPAERKQPDYPFFLF